MKRGTDIAIHFGGLYLIHQNIPGKKADSHHHPEHILFIPLQGEISVRVQDRALVCGPGRMIYLPPKTDHAFSSSDMQGERIIAMIDAKTWKAARAAKRGPTVLPASQLFKELSFYLLLHPKTKHHPSLVTTLIQTVSESMEMAGEAQAIEVDHIEGKARDERVRKAITLLRESPANPVSTDEVAKRSGLSVRSLNRLFMEDLGLTPKQVQTQYRIARARELLASGRATATEAALEAGYQSLSQFITVFRQITGQLPSDVARIGQKQ